MPLQNLPAWKATPDGLVLWASPQYKQVFGLDPVGRNVRDIFPAELADIFLESNAKTMESGEPGTEYFSLNGSWMAVKWLSHNGVGPVICGAAIRS